MLENKIFTAVAAICLVLLIVTLFMQYQEMQVLHLFGLGLN